LDESGGMAKQLREGNPPNNPELEKIMSIKKRPYVGIKHPSVTEIVNSDKRVTKQTHPQYHTVKGPFKTARGAKFMKNHANPKAMASISISELERMAAELNGTDASAMQDSDDNS